MSALRSLARAAGLAALLALAVRPALAELGSPDPSWREAMLTLRDAAHDTLDHAADPARLDALGAALLRVGRGADAEHIYRRALAIRPDDRDALAGLGRLAMTQQREAEAESLLVRAGDAEGAPGDLYRVRLRRHEWAAAAPLAEAQGEVGRRELLERLAALPAEPALAGPERVTIGFQRAWPVPLVRVKVNGQQILVAIDPGATELLLDPAVARLCHLPIVPGERTVGWMGARTAARNTLVPRLELGAYALANVSAAVTPLHKFSLEANPEGAEVQGVLGLPLLERFGVTVDFEKQQLVLRHPDAPTPTGGVRVPFERWGENELMVYGSLSGGRRVAMWVGMGLPDVGLGAPRETFDEIGIQPGKMANLVRSMGTMLQGRPWSQVIVPTVSAGSIVQSRVPAWSGAMDASEMWRWGMRRDAVLGPRFFAGHRVTFDWARHEMVFED